ncbi:MAG: Fe-S cluster assembly ATPase SufC [archaeon]
MKAKGKRLLEVRGLRASVGGKAILRGVDLSVGEGEIHLVMGPNGSGKSTLAHVIMGDPKYSVTRGKLLLGGKDISSLETDARAREGLFLALQHPTEISGVTLFSFLRAAVNSRRTKKEPVSLAEFRGKVETACRTLGIDGSFLERELNAGFSGGEKKRAEVLQALVLEPKLAVFDETDSGLDLDSLKTVATTIEKMRSPKFSAIVITHNPRVLKYIRPDKVHVLSRGVVVRTGGKEVAKLLEKGGYSFLREKEG